jgi:hypothetical protein
LKPLERVDIGDAVMTKIVGTSLDKQSEITALAAMDEHERQEIVDRAVAGEQVSAAEAQNAGGPSIPSTGSPSPADPAPSNSAEPSAARRTDGDGNYEVFKSRWVQYCEADFAALPAAMHTRFVSEVLGMSVPSGDTSRPVSPPSLPLSVQLAAVMAAVPPPAIGPEQINARNAALLRQENDPKDLGTVQVAEMLVDRPHAQNNQPSIIPASMQVPSQEHLAKPSQFVTFQNTDPAQTHIIINRYKQGVALQPEEKKVIEMVVDEIETFRYLARTDRGFYSAGQNAGKPFPPHPVKILDVGPLRRDTETEEAQRPREPERPKIEA